MESIDCWRLCDELSIFQAIMLILDYDPSNLHSYEIEQSRNSPPPSGYSALKTAIINAVESKTITARIVYLEMNHYDHQQIDIDNTSVSVDSVKKFLRNKSFKGGFFFVEDKSYDSYLDPQNPFFASKLAAAIQAWIAVTQNKHLLDGHTPKQAMGKWLAENAHLYGLIKEDGKKNEQGIEEICKIANWKPEGGASRTPTRSMVASNLTTPKENQYNLKVWGQSNTTSVITNMPYIDNEEDIPF